MQPKSEPFHLEWTSYRIQKLQQSARLEHVRLQRNIVISLGQSSECVNLAKSMSPPKVTPSQFDIPIHSQATGKWMLKHRKEFIRSDSQTNYSNKIPSKESLTSTLPLPHLWRHLKTSPRKPEWFSGGQRSNLIPSLLFAEMALKFKSKCQKISLKETITVPYYYTDQIKAKGAAIRKVCLNPWIKILGLQQTDEFEVWLAT